MRAIVLERDDVQVDKVRPAPNPTADEVLVRVTRAGVCETDLQLIKGYMGFRGVLGHEFVGVAESGLFAGQRVVGEINCACWVCETCRAGLPTHCPNRTVLGILNHDGAPVEVAPGAGYTDALTGQAAPERFRLGAYEYRVLVR